MFHEYHKKNYRLYLCLVVAIGFVYFFSLPTPLSLILGNRVWYWSRGLTRAGVWLLKLEFAKALEQNPLIYIVAILIIVYVFIAPVYASKKKKPPSDQTG